MSCVKNALKSAGSTLLHGLFRSGLVCKAVDWVSYERWRHRRRQVEERLRKEGLYNDTVLFGPFKGMKFTSKWASNRFEKIIGAYEAYVHGLIEEICRKSYSDIINVGCAEGYYVTGFARRIQGARIHAYDINQELLDHCLEIARLNGVQDRIIAGKFCDCAELNRLSISGKALIFSDCEGYELELLDPEKAPMLKKADILVEIHDFKNRAISSTMRKRFEATHTFKTAQVEGIRYSDYPVLRRLNFPDINAMVGEERAEIMEWFYLEAK